MQYEQVSPGSCLLRLLVEEGAKDASVRWLDLGLGDEPYKERFANNVRQTRYVHLSRGFSGHVIGLGRQILTTTAARFPQAGERLRGARTFCRALKVRAREIGLTATVRHAVRTAVRSLASKDEVRLFEWPESSVPDETIGQLLPLSREHLVEASILNADDAKTLSYLMRCAHRLSDADTSGFLLQDGDGSPVHFLWTRDYSDFHLSEIDWKLEKSASPAAMIFDCWTPIANRGKGYYSNAIRLAAERIRAENRRAWIFAAAANTSSLRGILKAGFTYRFSLVCRRKFGRSVVTRLDATLSGPGGTSHRLVA